MKKALIYSLSLALIISLTACGQQEPQQEPTSPDPTVTSTQPDISTPEPPADPEPEPAASRAAEQKPCNQDGNEKLPSAAWASGSEWAERSASGGGAPSGSGPCRCMAESPVSRRHKEGLGLVLPLGHFCILYPKRKVAKLARKIAKTRRTQVRREPIIKKDKWKGGEQLGRQTKPWASGSECAERSASGDGAPSGSGPRRRTADFPSSLWHTPAQALAKSLPYLVGGISCTIVHRAHL